MAAARCRSAGCACRTKVIRTWPCNRSCCAGARPVCQRARATVIAAREFHSIHLAQWIAETLHLDFVLRRKAGTKVEMDGNWYKAGELVWRGRTSFFAGLKVTADPKAQARVNLVTRWDE